MKKNQKRLSLNDILFWFSISSILYTYFGYPLLITILARRKPKKTYIPVSTLNVSLVIAAYNEELVIGEKINNCLQLDYPKNNLQIIVVSDGSDDQTPNIVQKYANQGIELLHSPMRRGKMAAINRAVPYSTGDIIIFSDANNLYQPDTIKNLVAPFVDPRVGATSGAKIIQMDGSSLGESEGFYWKYESFIKEQEYIGDNYALHLEVTRFEVENKFEQFNKMKQVLLNIWDSGAPEYLAQQNDGNDSLYMELREIVRDLK